MSKLGDRVIIVNEKDEQIGVKLYEAMRYEDIYGVTALWLTDATTGDTLLAQRKWTKRNDPGKWACAVAGTIEEGDTYDQNIAKEIEEEIGLTDLELTKGPKQFVDNGVHKYFCQWYYASVDKDSVKLTLEEDAVEQVAWIPMETLITDVKRHSEKYTPQMMLTLQLLGVA